MKINGNLKTPCNIYGICGCKQSGKNTVAKIWQLLDVWYNTEERANFDRMMSDTQYVKYMLEDDKISYNKSSWQEKSFAHSLKKILCILYGFKIEDFESEEFKGKELPESFWYWYMELDGGYGPIILPYTSPKPPKGYEGLKLIKPTPRILLQKIGTDLFRNQLHPNTWVNATMVDYKPLVSCHIEIIDFRKGTRERVSKDFPLEYPNWIITDVRFPNELQSIKDRGGISIRVNRLNSTIQNIHTHPSETALDNAKFDYVIDNNGTIDELIVKVKEILIKENIIWFTNQF